jgi:hypothetical protein
MRSDGRKKPAEGQTTRAPAKSGQHRSQQDTAPSSSSSDSIAHTHTLTHTTSVPENLNLHHEVSCTASQPTPRLSSEMRAITVH